MAAVWGFKRPGRRSAICLMFMASRRRRTGPSAYEDGGGECRMTASGPCPQQEGIFSRSASLAPHGTALPPSVIANVSKSAFLMKVRAAAGEQRQKRECPSQAQNLFRVCLTRRFGSYAHFRLRKFRKARAG